MKMSGFLKRTAYEFSNVNSIKLFYIFFFRPYCFSVWPPHYAVYIQAIECVHRRFIRLAAFKMNIDLTVEYESTESQMNIRTLSTRRTHRDLKLLYNIINCRIFSP